MEWWMWVLYAIAGFGTACFYSWLYGKWDLGAPSYPWDTRRDYPSGWEICLIGSAWPLALLIGIVGIVIVLLFIVLTALFKILYPENLFKSISKSAKEKK